MKFFKMGKDGGPKSTVTGYWLLELKSLFSIALLKFSDGSREEYHSHAFNCVSWVLSGELREHIHKQVYDRPNVYRPSWIPIFTWRGTFHRVVSNGDTWVFTIRGPWRQWWKEYNPWTQKYTTLSHGRKVVSPERAY
jgi:hypothetical protein